MINPLECCGTLRYTPFCPQCGKPIRVVTPLEALLAHCRKSITVAMSMEQGIRVKAAHAAMEEDRQHLLKRADSQKTVAERWQKWTDALAEVVEKPKETP